MPMNTSEDSRRLASLCHDYDHNGHNYSLNMINYTI